MKLWGLTFDEGGEIHLVTTETDGGTTLVDVFLSEGEAVDAGKVWTSRFAFETTVVPIAFAEQPVVIWPNVLFWMCEFVKE